MNALEETTRPDALRVGEPFGAKLAYGRLAHYAGPDGRCYPSMATLGGDIGAGPRHFAWFKTLVAD